MAVQPKYMIPSECSERVVSLSLCSRECFISASLDRTVLLWDQRADKCQGLLCVQGRPAAAYDNQGLVFAVAFGGCIRMFDARNYGKAQVMVVSMRGVSEVARRLHQSPQFHKTMSTEAEETNKRLNRDMISSLTRHLAPLRGHKAAGGSSHGGEEDEHGASIITLAGNNFGATLKSSLQADVAAPDQDADVAPPEWATLVNSNLQAINNSVMLGTKYKSHDPGVHVDISEDLEPEGPKRGWWRRKTKGGRASSASESDAHSSEAHNL
ncbi:hypothetical protein V2J09_017498 [Rumex salicifolius]